MTPWRTRMVAATALLLVLSAPCSAVGAPAALASDAAPSAAPAGVPYAWAEGGYWERVFGALEAAESARGTIGSKSNAHALASDLARLLPATETVGIGGPAIQVRDPAMPGLVDGLRLARGPATRRKALSGILAHLTSLDGSILQPEPNVPSDPAALKRLLAQMPATVDTGGASRLLAWANSVVRAIVRWLMGVASAPGGSTAVRSVEIAVLVTLSLLLAWVLFRIVVRWRRSLASRERRTRDGVAAPAVAAAEGLPADALAHAESLAGEGRFRDAVRALFGGAARSLVDLGLIGRMRTRTNAELLADVSPVSPEVAGPLRGLSDAFEAAWYGRIEPGASGYSAARHSYDAVLEAAADRARPRDRERPAEGAERE